MAIASPEGGAFFYIFTAFLFSIIILICIEKQGDEFSWRSF